MPLGTALLLLRSPSLFVPLARSVRYRTIGSSSTGSSSRRILQVEPLHGGPSPPRTSEASGTTLHSAACSSAEGDAASVPAPAAVAVATSPVAQDAVPERTATEGMEGVATSQQHVLAFAAATAATVVGTLVAWVLVGRGAVATGAVDQVGMAALAAALCASYIGGSVNFAAIIQVPLPALVQSLVTCAM